MKNRPFSILTDREDCLVIWLADDSIIFQEFLGDISWSVLVVVVLVVKRGRV